MLHSEENINFGVFIMFLSGLHLYLYTPYYLYVYAVYIYYFRIKLYICAHT